MHTIQNKALARFLPLERRDLLFCLLVFFSLAAWGRQVAQVLRLAWHIDEYTHILLVLPLSISLIYLEREKIRSEVRYAFAAGATLASISIAVAVVWRGSGAQFDDGVSLALAIFSLVIFWMAAFVGCYGTAAFRSHLFPLLFLLLLIPPPAPVLDKAIVYLQSASTTATFDLFRLTHLPVLRDGFILTFPRLEIEVAKECSGIRSSIMLLITGLILAHLFLRPLWTKVVFILFIVPLSVAKNAIRIFTLSMLGMYVDPGFLFGRLHHEGGIVFFLIALGGLVLLLLILQRVSGKALSKVTASGS